MIEYVTRGRHPADPTGQQMGDKHFPLPNQYDDQPLKFVAIVYETLEVIGVGEYRALWQKAIQEHKSSEFLIGPVNRLTTYEIFSKDQLSQMAGVIGEGSIEVEEFIKKMELVTPLPTPTRFLRDGGVAKNKNKGEGEVRAPRPPLSGEPTKGGTINRPKAGTATGKVWDIADKVAEGGLTGKALRQAIIETCVEAGIHQSTAGVQYSKWNRHRGSE